MIEKPVHANLTHFSYVTVVYDTQVNTYCNIDTHTRTLLLAANASTAAGVAKGAVDVVVKTAKNKVFKI